MSDEQSILLKRRQVLVDAADMSAYIPDELRARLELYLDDDQRMMVLELQLIAIMYGRALEKRDQEAAALASTSSLHQTSKLIKKQLVGRTGESLSSDTHPRIENEQSKPLELLIVPGQHLPRKV
jgi:hypothetical protein